MTSELDRLARKHEKVLLKLTETERQLEALNAKHEPLVQELDELREQMALERTPSEELRKLQREYATFALETNELAARHGFEAPGVVDHETGVLILQGAMASKEIGECECCHARAPLALLSDGTDSGEHDNRCVWGCQP